MVTGRIKVVDAGPVRGNRGKSEFPINWTGGVLKNQVQHLLAVWIRPGSKSPGDGPRIEIPGNSNKLLETLHY